MRSLSALAIIPFALGCGVDWKPPASSVDTLPNLTIPPPPTSGFQIVTPIFDNIQPGKDYEVCTWTDFTTDTDVDVRSTLGYQTEPPGHHVILFYTMVHQPPQTRICNDSDMATFRFLAGAGSNGELNQAPGDLVFHVPAGSQIVINHHYLNATEDVLRGQSAINANYADPTMHYTHNGYLAVLDSNLIVQEGDSSLDISATLDRDYKVWNMIPHMHQWGKHAIVTVTQSGTPHTMFDVDWDPSYAFHPPDLSNVLSVDAPMELHTGDQIAIHCEWNNTAGMVLSFGFEMCVAFANYIDASDQGNWAYDGGWGPF